MMNPELTYTVGVECFRTNKDTAVSIVITAPSPMEAAEKAERFCAIAFDAVSGDVFDWFAYRVRPGIHLNDEGNLSTALTDATIRHIVNTRA